MFHGLTEDMLKLLFIISEYTQTNDEDNPLWIKELPLLAIIHEGIVKGVFKSYDYSPTSVPMLDGTRRWLNISREGKDDIEDLINLQLIAILRLSTSQYGYMTAYKPTVLVGEVLSSLTPELKDEVYSLIQHECGCNYEVLFSPDDISFVCSTCTFKLETSMGFIEDVSYLTEPYFPSLE